MVHSWVLLAAWAPSNEPLETATSLRPTLACTMMMNQGFAGSAPTPASTQTAIAMVNSQASSSTTDEATNQSP